MKILRIPWIEHVSNDKALEKMEAKRTLILNNRNRVEISRAHNEERGLRKFDTHRPV